VPTPYLAHVIKPMLATYHLKLTTAEYRSRRWIAAKPLSDLD